MCKWGETKSCRVWVSAGDSHTGQGYWAMKSVDACLADMVDRLNAEGRLTRSCCCGHGKAEGSIIMQDGSVIPIKETK